VLILLLNLSSFEDKAPAPLLGKIVEDKYDYSMNQMVTKKYNNSGELTSTLKADRLIHYPGKQLLQLSSPTLDFVASDQPWSMKAATATLSETSQELILSPLVTIENTLSSALTPQQLKQKAIKIEVASLNFNLLKQTAYSSNQVNFSSGLWKVKGKGLAIDLKQETLEILNKVEAKHD
jgi:LPS export ABC transporter protein LptC